jgi:hypothetical protein
VFARRSATALGAALIADGSRLTRLWHLPGSGLVASADARAVMGRASGVAGAAKGVASEAS